MNDIVYISILTAHARNCHNMMKLMQKIFSLIFLQNRCPKSKQIFIIFLIHIFRFKNDTPKIKIKKSVQHLKIPLGLDYEKNR